MIATTICYEKGIAQNKSDSYKIVNNDQVFIDESNIIKDFRNTSISKDDYKDYIYDDLCLKNDYIYDLNNNKLKYQYNDEIENDKYFSTFTLKVYGLPTKLNNMFNFYKLLLDELEFEIKQGKDKRIIIGKPIEKYIHGSWDRENIDEYEMEIKIPFRYEG